MVVVVIDLLYIHLISTKSINLWIVNPDYSESFIMSERTLLDFKFAIDPKND